MFTVVSTKLIVFDRILSIVLQVQRSLLLIGYVTASMTALTLRMRGTAVSFSRVEDEKVNEEKRG